VKLNRKEHTMHSPAHSRATRALSAAATTSALMLLSACGGSSYSGDAPQAPLATQALPSTALADAQSYTRFVAEVAAAPTDVVWQVDGITAPTSDTDSPLPSL
jgi:hypothetical protein